jgi:hypothetical protein
MEHKKIWRFFRSSILKDIFPLFFLLFWLSFYILREQSVSIKRSNGGFEFFC